MNRTRRTTLRHTLHTAALALLPLGWAPARLAWAQDGPMLLEGQTLARRMVLAGSELQLNGAGVRAVAWFKGFVAALYLREKAESVDAVVGQPGPKRLQLRMLHAVPAEEFAKAFDKGVRRNSPAERLLSLEPAMAEFSARIRAVGQVRRGDVIDLDLDPARGMLFSINGSHRGEPFGDADFFAALLRSFVGVRPYDQRLKAGLLGHPSS